MSRTELHDWECAIKSLSDENADKLLAIAQDIYNTAFVRGKNFISLEQEPCEDCISRKDVLYEINRMGINAFRNYNKYSELFDFVDNLPSITPNYNSIKTELKPCEDCVSRQATIDALWKALYEYEDKTEKQFIDSEELDIADWFQHRVFVQNMSDIDRQTILNMPSVTPTIPDVENNFNLGYNCGYADAMSDTAESEE